MEGGGQAGVTRKSEELPRVTRRKYAKVISICDIAGRERCGKL